MAGVSSATNVRAEPTQFVSVAVIGGGVAGLAAAGALVASSSSSSSKGQQKTVLLLEARDELGGRVRQLRGLAPWPVEMGPEFVHGERSPVVQILRDAGCSLREYEWPDRWFFDDERVLRRADEDNKAASSSSSSSSPPASSSPPSSSRDRDVSLVQELFASVAEEEKTTNTKNVDVSAREWMNRKGLTSKRQQDIAEACFANDFGASLDSLGLGELVVENREWDVGEAYYVPDAPLSELVGALEAKIPAGCVRTRWPVSRVEVLRGAAEVRRELQQLSSSSAAAFPSSSSSSLANTPLPRQLVKLTGPNGSVVLARRVVVALPLAVLKASLLSRSSSSSSASSTSSSSSSSSSPPPPSLIQFSPPLSARKLAAMERLMVGNAIKIILSFSRPFWPADFFDAVCPGCFVPEFWVKRPPARRHHSSRGGSDSSSLSPHVVTGFLCGHFAQEAQALGERETVRRALEQLDEMFRSGDGGGDGNDNNKGSTSSSSSSPASDALVASRVVDWSLDPWALGAYSHPSLGAHPGDRRALASPGARNALFFAGEATHEAVNPCLQAAIETGERAAREVLLAEEEEEKEETTTRSKL